MTQEQTLGELGHNKRFDLLLAFRRDPENFKEHVKVLFEQASQEINPIPIEEIINEQGPVADAVDAVVDLHSFLDQDIATLDRNCLDIIKEMDPEIRKVFLGRYIIALVRSTYKFIDVDSDYPQRAWNLLWEDLIQDDEITERCRLEVALAYAALGDKESVAALATGFQVSPPNAPLLEQITLTLEAHNDSPLTVTPNWP